MNYTFASNTSLTKGTVEMKKKGCCMLLAAVLLLSGCSGGKEDAAQDGFSGYIPMNTAENDVTAVSRRQMADNGALLLEVNEDTGDVFVTEKATGYVWDTLGAIQQEGAGKALSFSYTDSSGARMEMNSLTDSVSKGQYRITPLDEGFSIEYSFGEVSGEIIYPEYIEASRYEQFAARMEPMQKAIVTAQYIHLNAQLYSEEIYAGFLETYPKAAGRDVYALRTKELTADAQQALSQAFSGAGYTKEELQKDNQAFGTGTQAGSAESLQYHITMNVTLDGGDLVVTVPEGGVHASIASSPVETLQVLQYFASPKPGDEGYFFIPDGSGSIMEFYNGSLLALQTLNVPLYGLNYALTQTEQIYDTPTAVFPVFGVKNGSHGYLAVIEEGDAVAGINVRTGTDTLSAGIWPEFRLADTQQVYEKSLQNNSGQASSGYTMQQPTPYQGEIRVRYHFLGSGEADYSGMARYYQSRLFAGETPEVSGDYPLYTELVAGVDYAVTRMGFTTRETASLTTFRQAGDIALELQGMGVQRQNVILSGFFKSGWKGGYFDKLEISKKSGGRQDFQQLGERLAQNHIGFYPELDPQYVYASAAGSVKKERVARTLVQQLAQKYRYQYSTYQIDREREAAYAYTPAAAALNLQKGFARMQELQQGGLSLRYLAKDLTADYKKGSVTDRQAALHMLTDACSEGVENGFSLLSRGGNAPFLKSLRHVLELPLYSSGSNLCSESVPFTAMVLSGYRDYAYRPVNLSGMEKAQLLKLMESNAGMYCLLSGTQDENLKDSDYHDWYHIYYGDQKESLAEAYQTLSGAMDGLYGQRIVRHERLARNVYKTTYENGRTMTVNYNLYPVTADGAEIAAEGYLAGGDGK